MFARWRADLATNTSYSPNTINRMISAIKRVVREAAAQGYVSHETASAFSQVAGVKPSAMRERTRPNNRTRITPEQMRAMLDIADTTRLVGLRDAAMLATLASSGLRVSELVALQVGNIVTTKSKGGKVAYKLQGVMGKGQLQGRDAALSVEAYNRIMAWIDARPIMSEFIFTQINTGTAGNVQEPTAAPITPEAAWKAIVKYAKRAGLEHVKPHDFRRFVGTQLAAKDIRQAQKALGHKSIETTARHYVLDELEAGLTDNLC
jgi:integrase